MIRWEFLQKGGEYFFGAPPAPADFWILIVDNKKLGAFMRNPLRNDQWVLLQNLEHIKKKIGYGWTFHDATLTVVEMKKVAEELLCSHL